MSTQVLVVGAGPVGLTMAAELARYGVPVRIIDKAPHRTDKSRALVLWSRTLELLDRAGCGGAFVAAGQKADAVNIVAGGRQIGRVGLGSVDSPHPYALMLPQSETERLLAEQLAGFGVAVERRVELVSFACTGPGVAATLRHLDRPDETLRTDWLIGCDGAHSTVRHALGLPFEGVTLQSDWLLADVHLSGLPAPASELSLYWHQEGALAVFPILPGRYRIIANVMRRDGMAPADPTLTQMQEVIARRGPAGIVASDPAWLSAFRINERKVTHYRSGRAFIAGDAAHVHSPAGGQGMNTGMQDAFNLAWKLALACRGTCRPEPLLDSYSVERSAVGAQVLADAGRLTALAVLTNHTAQAARNLLGGMLLGLAPVRRAMAGKLTEVSIGYRHSPLNGPGGRWFGKSRPGNRARPPAGQKPVGAGDAPRFALFAAPDLAAATLLANHAALLEPQVRPPLHSGSVHLVRPDGYTALVARAGDMRTVGSYLRSLALPPRARQDGRNDKTGASP